MDGKIAIVSGLPRSGTSMMMRMLEAGGMKVLMDNIRKADEDNPRGYYEFEKVKKLKDESSWLKNARGMVFKMVSMLLYDLPPEESYKIIFMKRNMSEILASQKLMLDRRGASNSEVKDEEMGSLFDKHLNEVQKWLETQDNIEVLYAGYNHIIKSPLPNAEIIKQFLSIPLDINRMAAVVDKSLYRQRDRGMMP